MKESIHSSNSSAPSSESETLENELEIYLVFEGKYKVLLNAMRNDWNQWRGIVWSWIGKVNHYLGAGSQTALAARQEALEHCNSNPSKIRVVFEKYVLTGVGTVGKNETKNRTQWEGCLPSEGTTILPDTEDSSLNVYALFPIASPSSTLSPCLEA